MSKVFNIVVKGNDTPTTTDITFNGNLITTNAEVSAYNVLSSDIDTDKVNFSFDGNVIELNKCYEDERMRIYSGTLLMDEGVKILNMIVTSQGGDFIYFLIVNSL